MKTASMCYRMKNGADQLMPGILIIFFRVGGAWTAMVNRARRSALATSNGIGWPWREDTYYYMQLS